MTVDATKINDAVRDCLDRCYPSDTPLAVLEDFLQGLCKDGWERAEIIEVRIAASRMLRALTADTDAVA
jgi:hypothetical protein